jgi:predicted TIM-barrel fold metal-dependent hydrolase
MSGQRTRILLSLLFFSAAVFGVLIGFVASRFYSGAEEASETEPPVAEQPSTKASTPPAGGNASLLAHDVYISFSDDPAAFPVGTLVTEGASVPDLLICTVDSDICEIGEMLLYFVDPINTSADDMETISFMRSTDRGASWSERTQVVFSGKVTNGPAVDPSVVQLPDGSIRMYYFGPDRPFGVGPPASDELHSVYSARSVDGIHFAVDEGKRLEHVDLTDPEVITRDDQWFMYYSVGLESGVAVSENGLDFTDLGVIEAETGGVPGALVLPDGTIRVYGCTPYGLGTAHSADGITFVVDTTRALAETGGICDSSVLPLDDAYVMVYKKIDHEQVSALTNQQSGTSTVDTSVPIIDLHAHFYPLDQEVNATYLEYLASAAEEAGVTKIFLGLNARQEPDRPPTFSSTHDDWVLDAVAAYPDLFVPTLNGFDPEDPAAVDYVREALASGEWKMLGELDLRNRPKKTTIAADGEVVSQLYDLAAEAGVPVMVHFDSDYGTDAASGNAEMARALAAHPETLFIFAHGCRSQVVQWMATYDNVYCEFTGGSLPPSVDLERVVVGTDIQPHGPDMSAIESEYQRLVDAIRSGLSALEDADRDRVAHGTIEQLVEFAN